ncbi:hypothetical protein KSF78_0001819 [Schistosoma japonicum]|nr:hypothetical protein KSF78_0001819 [Schistosoma japonicum]KAH8854864.1 hypothetical protein KSF78_0001819 [Schistosoma japonicum]KAH8854867.1 hypothetical protein KSF78_0001819 [Schistosoma japonicum]
MAYLKQLPYPLYSLWFFISGFSWMICLMGTCQLYLTFSVQYALHKAVYGALIQRIKLRSGSLSASELFLGIKQIQQRLLRHSCLCVNLTVIIYLTEYDQ